jgi:endonuclease/exonuclease/phosphatase family metal-dependent hydrolase
MRLLCWNIHKGIGGVDRRYDLHRILRVIDHYDPDILLLQEVDRDVPRSRRQDQTSLIATVLDYPHTEFGPNVRLRSGCYGNATLSRAPIVDSRNINLSFGIKKSRGALYTEIRTRVNGHTYRVHLVNVHLGLSGMERRWQIRRLLDSGELSRLDSASRIVIAGDTNDWNGALGRGPLSRAGFSCATGTGRRASLTFPAWQPVSALDRVFYRGAMESEHHYRGRLSITRQASDHLPVIVDFRLTRR